MYVLYVNSESKVRPRTFGCVAIGSVVGVFMVQIVFIFHRVRSEYIASCLSGFSVRMLCFVQTKTLCRYGCIYFLDVLVLVCVDVMVMPSA